MRKLARSVGATATALHPGAEETCGDEQDNDCDGEIDEGCVTEPPASHEVQVLLHCNPGSSVLANYGVGTHALPWTVQRNISYVKFIGGTTGKVTLHHYAGRTMDLTADTNLRSLSGGCCSTGRWNDSICELTVVGGSAPSRAPRPREQRASMCTRREPSEANERGEVSPGGRSSAILRLHPSSGAAPVLWPSGPLQRK